MLFDLPRGPSIQEQTPPSVVKFRMSPDRPGPEVEGPMSILAVGSGGEVRGRMHLEEAVPAHKFRSQPAYPHSISHPLVPTFTLCTQSPDNLLHPEWFQGWDPGVLILHRHQLHAPSPVGRGGHAEITKPPTIRL